MSCDVSSWITDQPLSEDITIEGAINRARAAKKQQIEFEIGVGLEGGLSEIQDNYFLVCVAALIDKNDNLFLGISSKLELPREVSTQIKNGEQFGQVIREYKEKHKEDKQLQKVADLLISRKESFTEAIRNAYLTYSTSVHYS